MVLTWFPCGNMYVHIVQCYKSELSVELDPRLSVFLSISLLTEEKWCSYYPGNYENPYLRISHLLHFTNVTVGQWNTEKHTTSFKNSNIVVVQNIRIVSPSEPTNLLQASLVVLTRRVVLYRIWCHYVWSIWCGETQSDSLSILWGDFWLNFWKCQKSCNATHRPTALYINNNVDIETNVILDTTR